MPASGPAAAERNSSLTSSADVAALEFEHAVGQRCVQHRRPHGMAVQAALQLGIDHRDRRGASGRGRRQRQHRRTRPTQITVRRIHHDVGVGRIMDRGDLAVPDADRLVHDLHHRGETVGGAGCGGQQPVPAPAHRAASFTPTTMLRARGILHRRRDDHAADAALEIAVQVLRRQELAGAFQHDIAAEIAPGHIAGRGGGGKADAMVADQQRVVVFRADPLAPAAVDAVEFQQMRRGGRAALQFVGMDDVEPVVGARITVGAHHAAQRRAERRAGRSGPGR